MQKYNGMLQPKNTLPVSHPKIQQSSQSPMHETKISNVIYWKYG